jgi:hypothetical protein
MYKTSLRVQLDTTLGFSEEINGCSDQYMEVDAAQVTLDLTTAGKASTGIIIFAAISIAMVAISCCCMAVIFLKAATG